MTKPRPKVAVPCRHATHYEIGQGKHTTTNTDRICDECLLILSVFAARRELAEAEQALDTPVT